MKCLYCSYWFI